MWSLMRLVAIAVVMAAGVGAASAQVVDPVTGISVSSIDPMDSALALSGQGGNAAAEMSADSIAMLQAQADKPSNVLAADTTSSPADFGEQAVTPREAQPMILPKGGTFKGPVTVTIQELDTNAIVYYTLDGSKPTSVSAVYSGSITVAANEKVRAMAVEQHMLDSGVSTNKYKVKAL